MPANPTAALSFAVNRIGAYSLLQLENVLVGNGAPSGGGTGNNFAPLPPPPLNEDMVGTPPIATTPKTISLARLTLWFSDLTRRMNANASLGDVLSPPPLDELSQALSADSQSASSVGQAAATPRAAWRGWFLELVNRLNALLPASGTGGAAAQVNFEAPSLDELDIDWYAVAPAVSTTDPLVVNVAIHGTSRTPGRTFAVGDFVIWSDPKFVSPTQYGYEIMQLTAIGGSPTAPQWTLARAAPGSSPGVSWFGTPTTSHNAGLKIYRLIDKQWNVTVPMNDPQVLKFVWDNMAVAAVQGTPAGGTPVLVNLIPTPPAVPAPGFRTLSGSEYLIPMSGTLTTGQTADYRVRISDWHTLRQMLGRLDGSATTPPAFVGAPVPTTLISLVYVAPNSQQAALVANFVVAGRLTYQKNPVGSRFPFDIGAWPANVWPELSQPFDANGKLQLPLTIGTTSLILSEDGWWDLIVTDASGGGSDFILAVQT